jgi:hypothetical protein
MLDISMFKVSTFQSQLPTNAMDLCKIRLKKSNNNYITLTRNKK